MPFPNPENEIYTALIKVANHPAVYGLGAGVVRFAIGDRTAGWRALMTNAIISTFVAIMASAYLDGEAYSDGKKTAVTMVAAFLARDLLIALLSIGAGFSKDPMGFMLRVREAFKGSTTKDPK